MSEKVMYRLRGCSILGIPSWPPEEFRVDKATDKTVTYTTPHGRQRRENLVSDHHRWFDEKGKAAAWVRNRCQNIAEEADKRARDARATYTKTLS